MQLNILNIAAVSIDSYVVRKYCKNPIRKYSLSVQ